MAERPMLDCPECGEPLIPAQGRARIDSDGNEITHRDDCRCRWCGWMWWEHSDPTICACEARVVVGVDDGTAYTRLESVAKAADADLLARLRAACPAPREG